MVNKEEILKCFLKTKGWHSMGPIQYPSGFIGPFNVDNVKVYSEPQRLRIICQAMWELIEPLQIDIIVGIASAGITLSVGLSQISGLPFIFVKKDKDPRSGEVIQGEYQKGMKGVLIDDVIGAGKTKVKVLEHLGDLIKVEHIIVNWSAYPDEPWQSWIKEKGIKVHFPLTWQEIEQYLHQHSKFKEVTEMMLDFISDIYGWKDNPKFQEKFKSFQEKTEYKFGEPII